MNVLEGLPADWIEPPFERERLPGDGGHRIYTRLRKNGESRMLAFCGPSDPGLKNFLRIRRLLEKAGVRVPAVYKANLRQGLLLLEDLGDMTLERFVKERGAKAALPLYRKALRALARLQEKITATEPRFGKDFFMKEAATALKNMETLRQKMPEPALFRQAAESGGQERRRRGASAGEERTEEEKAAPLSDKTALDGGGPPRAAAEAFLREMNQISSQLEKEPYVFCCRDFHSRNLMAIQGEAGGELALIDFQDAGAGPFCYDVTSLLYDSYIFLGEEAQKELLLFYRDGLPERLRRGGGTLEKTEAVCRLQFLQRGFKACGCFAGFYVNEGRAGHLKFLPGTLKRLEETAGELSYRNIKKAVRFFRQSFDACP